MKIVLSSNNKNKLREMKALLLPLSPLMPGGIELLSFSDIGFSGDIEENGSSFEENAKIKASVPASLGYYGIADDSGLEVDALGGAPGIYSARYSGGHGDSRANNEKLLRELDSVPDDQRGARFVSALSMVAPEGGDSAFTFTVRGECSGKILRGYRGDGGFGYDPLFLYEPLGKTFAELSDDEKNSVSHRAEAFRRFSEELKKRIQSIQR